MTSPAGNGIPGTPRFLLYSHDALGLGHVRRNLAAALVERSPGPSKAVTTHRGAFTAWLQLDDKFVTQRLPSPRRRKDGL
jgi:predicted glycosyltransferase